MLIINIKSSAASLLFFYLRPSYIRGFDVGGHGGRDGRRVVRGNRCLALCCTGDVVVHRAGRLADRPGAGRWRSWQLERSQVAASIAGGSSPST